MQPNAPGSVSPTMNRVGVLVALAVAGLALYIWQRPRASTAASAPAAKTATPSTLRAVPSAAPAAAPAPVDKVTKLGSIDERRQLADRIAAAQAARAATSAPPRPALPEPPPPSKAQLSKATIRDAMREVIPHLRDCYVTALPTLASTDVELTATIHLTGDPDVGTLVDADALADKAGTPLPTAFDDCLRSTFMLMALPPLTEGSTLQVRYPFKFSAN